MAPRKSTKRKSPKRSSKRRSPSKKKLPSKLASWNRKVAQWRMSHMKKDGTLPSLMDALKACKGRRVSSKKCRKTSPKRKSSGKRKSPKRKANKRKSPKRKSSGKRKSFGKRKSRK